MMADHLGWYDCDLMSKQRHESKCPRGRPTCSPTATPYPVWPRGQVPPDGDSPAVSHAFPHLSRSKAGSFTPLLSLPLLSLSPFPKMLFSPLRPPPARSPSVDPQFISNHELGKGLCWEGVDPLSPLFSFRFFFWYWSILICTQPVRLEYLGRC